MEKTVGKNVILITIDCLRADHLGCLGYSKNTSPNIDDLAQKGALFTQAFSNGSDTLQSFPSILTSTYSLMYGDSGRPLSEQRITIAETLKKYGYSTAAFHSNPYLTSYSNYNRGFDTFEDFLHEPLTKTNSAIAKIKIGESKKVPSKLHKKLTLARRMVELIRGDLPGGVKNADIINRKALCWLRANPDGFFLWLHYMDTHAPYIPPASFRPEAMNWWMLFKLNYLSYFNPPISEEELTALISLYDGEIRYVDHTLGLFLGELEKIGICLDNTFMIIASDHGDEFMEHGGMGHGNIKQYQELVHVPLIISGPGIKENAVVNDLVSLLDLSPTIIDLVNIQRKPPTFMGTSLLPLLKGQKRKGSRGVIIEWRDEKGISLCYRTDEWKYLLMIDERGMRNELYNVQKDRREMEDLSEKEERKCMQFKSKLLKHISMEEKTVKTAGEKLKIREKIKALKHVGKI